MGLFVYTQKGSIISMVDLPTTEIIEPAKVKWTLLNGGAYYSEPMNKFYSTKEQYLKEIYR